MAQSPTNAAQRRLVNRLPTGPQKTYLLGRTGTLLKNVGSASAELDGWWLDISGLDRPVKLDTENAVRVLRGAHSRHTLRVL